MRLHASSRRGSLAEAVIAALVIGVSALPILELLRSGTATLEITEEASAAHRLGADILETISGRTGGGQPSLDEALAPFLGTPTPWDLVLAADPALAVGFPADRQGPILSRCQAKVKIEVQSPYVHVALGPGQGVKLYRVTVLWLDHADQAREVVLARIVSPG
jgi:hypothetical protein